MKKKIIIIALIVAVIGAAAGFFLTKRGGGGGDFPKPVEEYTAGVESVASITSSIEEGKKELLLSVSTNEEPEQETEEVAAEEEEKEKEPEKEVEEDEEIDKKEAKRREKEAKKKAKEEKKAQKKREKEEKKRNKETEEAAEQEQKDAAVEAEAAKTEVEEPWNKYYYQSGVHTVKVLEAYAAYLEEEGFEQVQGKEQETVQNKQPEDGVKTSFYAKYQRKCEEEGYLFSIELEYPIANDPSIQMYAVKATREKAPAEDSTNGEGMTRDRALSYLASLDSTSLGLTKPLSEYYVIMDMGRSYVEGKDCYGINVYDKGAEKESYFVQKYYISIGDQEIYSCDVDGVIRRLQPAQGTSFASTAPTEGTTQTAGNGTPASSDVMDTNTGGVAHDWNFGPPEEKEEE